MSANTFGQIFRMTSFGESHGSALGVVIDGCPAGVPFDLKLLTRNMERRRPGSSASVSARNELDEVEILSGVYKEKTLGTPIAMMVRNKDSRSTDYSEIEKEPRIGHADDVWLNKYSHVDFRGGGRSSGRETLTRVMAGSVAQMYFRTLFPETEVLSWVKRVGPHEISADEISQITSQKKLNELLLNSKINFPSIKSKQVENFLADAIQSGESYGGISEVLIKNPPRNLGQPVFHKLKSDFAAAVMSIGATTAFEFGAGVESVESTGSEFHKTFANKVYGGIRGGISTGEDISLKVHFKPTSSIKDIAKKGRHDPCIVPRAVPVIESMIWLVLADHALCMRMDRV